MLPSKDRAKKDLNIVAKTMMLIFQNLDQFDNHARI